MISGARAETLIRRVDHDARGATEEAKYVLMARKVTMYRLAE
jgi:hypothetical protein